MFLFNLITNQLITLTHYYYEHPICNVYFGEENKQKNNISLLSYFNSDNMAMTEILKINKETRKYGLILSP